MNRRRKLDLVLDLNNDPPYEVVGSSTLQEQQQQPQASAAAAENNDDDDVVECSPTAFQLAKLNAERRRVRSRTIVSLEEVIGIMMTFNDLDSEYLPNSHEYGNIESSANHQNQAIINADPQNQTIISADPHQNHTIIDADPQNQTIIIGYSHNQTIINGDPQNEIIINGQSANRTIIIGHSENQTIIIGDPPNQTIINGSPQNHCIINGNLCVNLESSSHSVSDETALKSPEPVFTCPICMAPMEEETSTKCGHIFCKGCIMTAVAANGKCPACRKKVTRNSLIRVFLPSTN